MCGARRPMVLAVAATTLLLAAVAGCSDTTSEPTAAPGDTGAPTADTAKQIATAEVFADLDEQTPGCAVAVRHPGGRHLAAFGMADLEAGTPITDETVFDLGSVSKQFTAGAVALLVADGRLDLDADVTELVAGLGPYDEVITVADLLHHTSGLPDYLELLDADDAEVTTNQDALASLEGAGTNASPGTEFEYSNTNYVLLALIVEAVDGRTLVQFSADEIFGPLGIDRTVVRDDQGPLLAGQAQGYAPDGDDWTPVGSWWRQTGDGAVHATAEDLLAWMALFLDPPRTEAGLGGPDWLEVLTTPGPVGDDGQGYGGGLGLSEVDGSPRLEHSGSWIGYGSALVMAPEDGVGVAVACNIDDVDAADRADEVLEIWTAD